MTRLPTVAIVGLVVCALLAAAILGELFRREFVYPYP